MTFDISKLTIVEARRALDAKEYSAVELAQAHLDTIQKQNSELNAYLEVYDDVIAQAETADAVIASGQQQALTGIPIAVKDNILIRGKRVSSASKILEGYVASYDATVIERLKKQNTVFIGRTNMDEFAMGSSTEHSAFGRVKNPIDPARVPGGSSGGSAAAVAGGIAVAALGSDTGGSVRQPAAFCGVVGLKPTYGAVSRFGLMAMASSLDQVSPFARTVKDARLLFDAIRGRDANDSTSLPDEFFATKKKQPKTIGVPRAFLTEGMDADVLARFEETLEKLRGEGYTVVDIELPHAPYALSVYYIIMPAEASTNLARYDGIRYGLSVEGADSLDIYRKTRGQGFGPEVRRRILIGTFVLSSGYADAYYRKAIVVRDLIRKDFEKAFTQVDVIATPTVPTPAFRAGEKEDPIAMYAADIFTIPVNLAGVPGISVPMGTVVRDGNNLPLGMQFIAPHGGEDALFTMSEAIERMALQ
ncbi:Asp-tRNA(Asn)/Glu-tRNA(Gln) amidotransferase subunit GatA [Candidatus Kaiserbacteria bacterium]|nr:Asp-tRNA(Asn)/Glu-tRNA(Gln) amidotransferase subunit GatA [Candidatus Kaiserbacteria bacterium]